MIIQICKARPHTNEGQLQCDTLPLQDEFHRVEIETALYLAYFA